jgi:DNA-binding NtrC family response regulator
MSLIFSRPPERTGASEKSGGNGERKKAGPGFTILIVDDEPGVRRAISRMLGRQGYKTVEAESGPDALAVYKNGGVDLVVSDFNMTPEMDGLGLLKALRAHNPAARVITHAGGLSARQAEELWEEGVFDILEKPAEKEKLYASVCAALQKPLETDIPMEEGIMRSDRKLLRVLFVDDDPDTRFALCEVAGLLGYEARSACNGRDALEVLAGFAADLVVSDLHMPEMNGLALLMELRVRDPKAKVLIVSGEANADEIKALADAGALMVLRKPVAFEALQRAINESLAE